MFQRVSAKGSARQKLSSHKTEGIGGQFVGRTGKNIIARLLFAQSCAAGRANINNWPRLEHSPGEVACFNVETASDSCASQGILQARVGEG